jgi:hypothetical protein
MDNSLFAETEYDYYAWLDIDDEAAANFLPDEQSAATQDAERNR